MYLHTSLLLPTPLSSNVLPSSLPNSSTSAPFPTHYTPPYSPYLTTPSSTFLPPLSSPPLSILPSLFNEQVARDQMARGGVGSSRCGLSVTTWRPPNPPPPPQPAPHVAAGSQERVLYPAPKDAKEIHHLIGVLFVSRDSWEGVGREWGREWGCAGWGRRGSEPSTYGNFRCV